jgi:O-antigen/teichoic acid export membrane protein
MSSLKKLATQGAAWVVVSYGVSNVIQLGSNLILTRLLTPDLFGLMSLVATFITALHLFSDIGVGPNIIQNKRGDDPVFQNTAWTLQVIRSICLWFGCLLIAWPIANFFNEPRFLWLIPIIGLNTVISGFNSTTLYTLNRHLEMRKLAIIQLATQITSTTVIIVWAWLNPTIWALVIGSLVSSSIGLVWSHRINPSSPNRFVWDQEALKEIFSFGRWIFLSTIITFFAENADRLTLGKVFTMETLGIYTIALRFADTPRQITNMVSNGILFPAISKLADLPRATVREKLLRNRFPILIVLACGLTLLVCFGDMLILLLYDKRYSRASWMLPILALGIWPEVLSNTNGPSLFAMGKPQYGTAGAFVRAVWTVFGITLGYTIMGLEGAVIAIALNDLLNYAIVNYGLWREGLSGIVQDIQVTLLLLTLIVVVSIVRFGFGFGLPINGLLN